jgi:glycosyltransferase involved in cell wall biosynthesis
VAQTRTRRILLASQPLDAGVPQHVLDLVGGLDPARFTVDVACPPESSLWTGLERMPWVTRHPITSRRDPGPSDAESLARLTRLAGRADIVHGHSAKAGFLLRLAAALRGRTDRCLFTPHGWSFWAADGGRAGTYVGLERLAARWCRVILAVSAHEREAGLAQGIGPAGRYRVVPNGVDLARFARTPEPVPGQVIAVGRLARQKRPDIAVRAFAAIRDRVPGATLAFVGDGPERPAVESLVQELGLADAVRLLGARDDVAELLASAHCLLLASDYEGCPLSVIEAMAAGVPVVATRVGGVPEIVADGATGLLAEPRDPAGLARALAGVLTDPALARRLGDAGRERAHEQFGRELMARRIVAIYDEILGARHRPG